MGQIKFFLTIILITIAFSFSANAFSYEYSHSLGYGYGFEFDSSKVKYPEVIGTAPRVTSGGSFVSQSMDCIESPWACDAALEQMRPRENYYGHYTSYTGAGGGGGGAGNASGDAARCEKLKRFVASGDSLDDLAKGGYYPAGQGRSTEMSVMQGAEPFQSIFGPVDPDWAINVSYASAGWRVHGEILQNLGRAVGSRGLINLGHRVANFQGYVAANVSYLGGQATWYLLTDFAAGNLVPNPVGFFAKINNPENSNAIDVANWFIAGMTMEKIFEPAIRNCKNMGKW